MKSTDWPIEGPRTAGYVLKELGKTGLDAAARIQRWRFENSQRPEMRTRIAHELLSDVLDLAFHNDQLDVISRGR